MLKQSEKQYLFCQELRRLGYGPQRRIKLYGDQFDLISEAFPDGRGYAIHGISRQSVDVQHIRIPLPIVHMIEHELMVMYPEIAA
jgi:hypothetical protein